MKYFDLHLHTAAPKPLAETLAYHKDYLDGTDTERAVVLSIPSHADGLPYGQTSYMQNVKALFYKLYFPHRLYALCRPSSLVSMRADSPLGPRTVNDTKGVSATSSARQSFSFKP